MKAIICIALTAAAIGCKSVSFDSPGLPPVHATTGGAYFLPGCDRYDELPERSRILIPTAQEAELRGYRPAGDCEQVAAVRIHQEIELLGRMEASSKTESQKAELRRHQTIERQNDEIQNKQEEIERKQNDIERERELERIRKMLE